MGVVLHLSVLALRQVLGGACQAIGLPFGDEAARGVVGFLTEHFTAHSQRLNGALQKSTASAWKALEIALAGDSLWERCQVALARGDDQAFRQQLRTFLDALPLANLPENGPDFRRQCLQELRAARAANLLTGGELDPGRLARRVGAFAQFGDPQKVVEGEWRVLEHAGEALRQAGHVNLARLMTLRPADGPPLLVLAVCYFFRREVETDAQLFQGLAFARLEQLGRAQEQGFAALDAALARQGQRLEEMLADVRGIVVETHGAVVDLQEQMRGQSEQLRQVGQAVLRLLEQHQLQRRELRPADSLSIRNDAERRLVQQLVARYRTLPEEEQRRVPGLLNALGKLEVVAGDFDAAQKDFQRAASLTPDVRLQAEAHYHAYQAALQRRDWTTALQELLEAVRRDARRLAPFPVGKLRPVRILGAGGFGVVFLCNHRYMAAPVVVKSLMETDLDLGMDQVFTEATVLQQLDHPAIVRIQDCGFTDPSKKSRPYLVMDYFEGITLEDQARQQPLSQEDLLTVAGQVAAGLQAAHGRGILHRDVKPANVLVRRGTPGVSAPGGWSVKLIDFGLALNRNKLHGSQATSKTLLGHSIAGTLDYAAPEQLGKLEGVAVSRASDVYGFGKTCCYALFQTPEPTLRHWQGLPAPLAELLGQCLEKRPEDRPAHFGIVLERLAQLAPRPPEAIPVRDAPLPVAIPVGPTAQEQEQRLREAGDRAEAQRQRLEEQERRLREAAAEAEAKRRTLEEQQRRQNDVVEVIPVREPPRPPRNEPPEEPVTYACPHCGETLRSSKSRADRGAVRKCPYCKKLLTVGKAQVGRHDWLILLLIVGAILAYVYRERWWPILYPTPTPTTQQAPLPFPVPSGPEPGEDGLGAPPSKQ